MDMHASQRNRNFAKRAAIVCAAMFLFGFACVPIYRIACAHGYLGGRVDNVPDSASKVSGLAADETAMEALAMMRGLIHQLGNNAHELALQFDLALNSDDAEEQKQIQDQLRTSLHRFINITHEVSQIDARLTGYQPPKDRHTN